MMDGGIGMEKGMIDGWIAEEMDGWMDGWMRRRTGLK